MLCRASTWYEHTSLETSLKAGQLSCLHLSSHAAKLSQHPPLDAGLILQARVSNVFLCCMLPLEYSSGSPFLVDAIVMVAHSSKP